MPGLACSAMSLRCWRWAPSICGTSRRSTAPSDWAWRSTLQAKGAKRVLFPVLAGTVRMIIAAFIGWSVVTWFGAGLSTLFQIVALAAVSYGLLTAAAVLGGAWGQRPANQSLAQIVPA